MGKAGGGMVWLLVIGALVLVGTGLVKLPATTQSVGGGSTDTVASGSSGVSCPDTKNTVFFSRQRDTGASTLSYVANSQGVRYKNVKTGQVEGTHTASAGGFQGTGLTLTCGETYEVVALSVPDSVGSSVPTKGATIVASGNNMYLEFEAPTMDNYIIRYKDIVNDTYLKLHKHDQAVDTGNSTGYTTMNTTRVYSDIQGNQIDVGADGYIDAKFSIKTATTNKVGGDPRFATWIVVDVGTNGNWQEPVISFEGTRLSPNQKAQMKADDITQGTIGASEYAYRIPATIGDTEKVINFYIKSKAGANPVDGDDVLVCVFNEGAYISAKEANSFKAGVYTDNSTQTLVTYDNTMLPCAKIMTS